MFRKVLSGLVLPLLLLLGGSSENSAAPGVPSAPGFVPGPDVIAGNMADLYQDGASGSQRGLAMGITTCNGGNAFVNFFAMPDTRHPAAAQNLYRMSGGSGNNERFEQIGQAWVKHTYGAKQANSCNFGCLPGGNLTHLGVGCSDTYFASQSATQSDLGSRARINPFTGIFSSTARDHTGHVHTATSHLLLGESNDLNTVLNPGATYYAELLYITPDEYAWCQSHPGECNMYNNASYLRYDVTGTTNFSFLANGSPVRMSPAINACPGAIITPIEPEPGVDGRAFIDYKVTNPSAGVWHYEYALYNQNLDRAIQSFSVPLGCDITLSNLGFHAPLNHPGFPNDGTLGDAGFSNAPWTSNQTTDTVSWSSETFAQNQNANAIRWGTLYNFRFDSDKPPITTTATIGFFKTGSPVTLAILGPNACDAIPSPTPTATPPNPTPTVTPSATPPTSTPTPTGTPPASPTPAISPVPAAQALNLSTRMLVQSGANVGIAGFIITGAAPKHVLIRALGPSITGLPGVLDDPMLELYRPGAFTITNDNWGDDPAQAAAIIATGIPPANDREAAIDATLNPGAYTAIIRGKFNSSGVALIEVYDLSPTVPSKLANISTRAFVSSGNSIVIAGFILGGNSGSDNIVLRGIGPSIACGGGCSSLLQNPTLELRDNNGALLVANNDWQDNPAQASEISGAGLAPMNSREAAIATALPPGLYTALLADLNHGTGLGLVEVYDLGNSATPFSPPGQCIQNFDSVIAGNLPPGWSATVTIGSFPSWRTSTIDPHSPPNDLFVNDQEGISDKIVTSPPILINSASAVLSFRNSFNTEYAPPPSEFFWDGYVLEVSINGGPFNDVTHPTVGGTFVTGGYTGEITAAANNPLAGRMAWSGNSGGYTNTVINLGPGLIGQTISLRFRMGTDEATGAPGVRVDGLAVSGASCFYPSPTPYPTPTPVPGLCTTENFDNVAAPALPLGWSAEVLSGNYPTWETATEKPDSPPNDLFVGDQDGISDKVVTSPPILINSASAVLTFRNNFLTEYDTSTLWDGFVLEVSINGGPFNDVTDPAVGGTFVSGGYTGYIDSTANNPLAGRLAWSGDSGGYITTVINLGPNLNGQSIRLRFRMGTDEAVSAPGVRIDGLAISCFGPSPTPGPSPSPGPSPTPGPSPIPSPSATPDPCIEGFDNVIAPALPPGWSAEVVSDDLATWATTTTTPDSPPNDLFVEDQDGISENLVTAPPIRINSASGVLTFRNNFRTEYAPEVFWDGFVLEVSINGGPFLDVTYPAVGFSFVAGGYTGNYTLSLHDALPIWLAWSGDSGGYINTVINLGPSLNGSPIRLRFRMGTDEAVGAPGVRIDGLSISGSCLGH